MCGKEIFTMGFIGNSAVDKAQNAPQRMQSEIGHAHEEVKEVTDEAEKGLKALNDLKAERSKVSQELAALRPELVAAEQDVAEKRRTVSAAYKAAGASQAKVDRFHAEIREQLTPKFSPEAMEFMKDGAV